ncbi:MAG: hypothetical protein AVDCRST_MAG17-1797, partial [uncultured Solirubrobacterales bacterium]
GPPRGAAQRVDPRRAPARGRPPRRPRPPDRLGQALRRGRLGPSRRPRQGSGSHPPARRRARSARAQGRHRVPDVALPGPALGGDTGVAGGTAPPRLPVDPGHAPGRRGHEGHASLPLLDRLLLRHAQRGAARAPLRVRVHERLLPPLERQGRLRRDRRGRRGG